MVGEWPEGRLRVGAPVAARYAVQISLRLREAMDARAPGEVAAAADLARSTLHDLLNGRSWPDVVSLAKLEVELNVSLWPPSPLRSQ
jgi:transcriptional regulator with XRE-family HTH domain